MSITHSYSKAGNTNHPGDPTTVTGEQILARLEELLVAEIPRCVKALSIVEPVYCLRIWWYGTDSCPKTARQA